MADELDVSLEDNMMPLLPLRDVVVFPHMVIPLFVGRPKSIKALETAMEAGKSILLVAQKSAAKDEPDAADLYDIGCISNILQMLKLPDGTVKVLVEGTQRARISKVEDRKALFVAEVAPIPINERGSHEIEAMRRTILAQFDQYVKLNKKIPPEILTSLSGIDDAGRRDVGDAKAPRERRICIDVDVDRLIAGRDECGSLGRGERCALDGLARLAPSGREDDQDRPFADERRSLGLRGVAMPRHGGRRLDGGGGISG